MANRAGVSGEGARLGLAVGLALLAATACGSSTSGATAGDGGGGDAAPPGDGATAEAGPGGDGGTPGDGGGDAHAGGDSGAAAGPDGGAGGIPGGQPGTGTTFAGCTIFPDDNPWNVQIDGPGVQVVHTYDTQLPQGTSLHPDFGGWTNGYGIPINVVPASQADLPTTFTLYASQSDPGPGGWVGTDPVSTGSATGTTAYPFFGGMHIEGNPAAGGSPGSLPGDQHGLVLQQGTSGCTAYEAWSCVAGSSPPFQCANGAVFDLTRNTLRPAGWTSADAAGLSVLAGLVRLAEVQAGAVTHALRVTFNQTQNGYIPPATHAASSHPLGSAYPPMGLRLRLKASVSTSGYSAGGQVIMAAMKTYGLIVADNGSDWYFTGDSDDGWNATAPDGKDTIIGELVADFASLKGADFEAVYTGGPVATGL